MKKDMKAWTHQIINSVERKAMPVMTYPGLRHVNKTILDVVRDGEAQAACIEAVAREYPSIAAMTIMDLSVEAEAFGAEIRYSRDEVPTVVSGVVTGMESAKALKVPEVGSGRTKAYIRAAEIVSSNIKDRPVFGGEIGPFSLAGRLMDMTQALMAVALEPDVVHEVLQKTTEFLVEYALAFKNAGANGIIIAEPAAGLLSPEQCEEFSSCYVKKIVDAVQDNRFIVILHNCGNTKNLVPSMVSTGAVGFHFGNAVNMSDIMPQIPWGRIAFGNVDPSGVLKNGSRQEVESKVWELLESTANYKNFVLSSGCDVPPGTPAENIDAFFDTLGKFNSSVLRITG